MSARRWIRNVNMARSIGSGFLIGAFIKIMQILTGQSGAFGKRGVGFDHEQTLPAMVWTMFNVVMGASEQAARTHTERKNSRQPADGQPRERSFEAIEFAKGSRLSFTLKLIY